MTTTPYSERIASRLRLAATPAERRLLRGYGPLVGLLLAFVLMALLVPTVAPEKVAVGELGGSTAGTSAGVTTSGSSGATAATAGSAGTSGSAASSAGPATSASSGIGSAQEVAGCEQVPGDPYSPPCIKFSGSNGGATSQGVTASCINISFRTTSDMTTFQQQLAAHGGASFGDTISDITRTVNGLATYFNKNFQFYGRKLCIKDFAGEGSLLNELVGGGQQQADVDAQTASTLFGSQGTFAELDGVTEPYDTALYQYHIISFGAPYLPSSLMAQYAPYMWSVATECDDVANLASQFEVNDLPPGPAVYAGGSLKDKPRKYGVIVPDISYYNSCLNSALTYQAAHGEPVASQDDIRYPLIISSLASEAQAAIARLQSDGVTTVACGCDPIFPIYLSQVAASQGYYPEWVVVGVAGTDQSIVGQLDDQAAWAHALGISFSGNELPNDDNLGYAAYKTVNSDQPAEEVNLIYEQMYEMAIGIQMAGPDLTPSTFEAGMRKYPGSQAGAANAEFGTWDFPAGHFTPQVDAQIICWDPQAYSPYTETLPNPKPGAYWRSPSRYASGQIPATTTPCPSWFPSTSSSS